jgi:hypothetical protein
MKNIVELIEQIKKVEGVKIGVSIMQFGKPFDTTKRIYNDYPYTIPMDGNKTVDDLLNERVYPAIKQKAKLSLD